MFENTLFRCSAIGNLMTEPKLKKDKEAGNLSESAKTHCIDIFVSTVYGRQSDIQNRYVNKGLMVEEDSITLYSRIKKQFYKKNQDHLSNQFIKGTPDLYMGKSIKEANLIIDVKSSWDIYTFHRTLTKDINDLYYWQLQGYMDLTGAKSAKLAYCLIDTPLILINDEKRKLLYKMGAVTEENEDYQTACDAIDLNMTYSDIPMDKRVIEFEVERNDDDISAMYSKVLKAREFLDSLYQKLYPEQLLQTA